MSAAGGSGAAARLNQAALFSAAGPEPGDVPVLTVAGVAVAVYVDQDTAEVVIEVDRGSERVDPAVARDGAGWPLVVLARPGARRRGAGGGGGRGRR